VPAEAVFGGPGDVRAELRAGSGRWYCFKSCDVAELTDDIIDPVEHSLRTKSPLTSFPVWQMGGAVGRVGDDETAFNGPCRLPALKVSSSS
jgi:hypothetical protein